MQKPIIKVSILIIAALLLSSSLCWAKAQGYCYVVGYSYKLKKAFFSIIFSQQVRDVSYSDEEYTTDVVLIQKMESQFQAFLASDQNLNAAEFTITARGAYKNESIAMKRFNRERQDYKKRGFQAMVLKNFIFKN